MYAKRGIPDDRIAATIHRYIEVKKDKRVLDTIQEASSAMKTLVEPPKCLELPMPHLFYEAKYKNQHNIGGDEKEDSDFDADTVNTSKTAAALLNQVILALKSALPKFHGIKHEISSSSTPSPSPLPSQLISTFDRNIDSLILTLLGISVPIRMISPRVLRTAALAPSSFSSSALELLKNVLKVTIDVGNGKTIQRDFTLQQYYSILNIYSESPEVAAVLKEHSADFLEPATCLEDLQNGALGLSFAVHPTVSYVLQLKSIIARGDDPDKGNINSRQGQYHDFFFVGDYLMYCLMLILFFSDNGYLCS